MINPNSYDVGLSEGSSAEVVLLVSPDKKSQVDEITKLKMQNGLLMLERVIHSRLKASKELCFKRWKNRQ